MKVVVAGGTGFIGKALVEHLLAGQHEVMLLTRDPSRAGITSRDTLVVEQWDARSGGGWENHLNGARAVFNFAGESIGHRWTPARKQRIIDSRVHATRALVTAIGNSTEKPPVLVNASAVGFYGHVPQDEVTEDFGRGTGFLSDTVQQWEEEAMKASDRAVRVVLLRSGVVLGRGGGALARMILPFKMFVGGPMGSGEQWFPWVHIHDLVRAALHAAERPSLSGPVNLAAPQSVTMRTFCAALAKVLHRPSWLRVPGFALRLALGEMAEMLLTGQRVVPRKLEKSGFKFSFPLLQQALEDVV
jgi:hypothetical protein